MSEPGFKWSVGMSWGEKPTESCRLDDISGWFKNNDGGPYVRAFEKAFAEFLDVKYAYAVSSGSAALYIALMACEVKDLNVAVPTYTHIGSVAPIVLARGYPMFVEADEFGNLDPEDLEERAWGMPKAIIPVHQLGMPCDMDEIKDIVERRRWGSLIIEDASHALGSSYKGRNCGLVGDIGCFSIGGGRTKTIGTGEGGMIVTNNEKLAERIKNIRNHGDRNFDVNYFCFDEETEILTENGWSTFQDLENEKIATLTDEGNIEFHKPHKRQKFHYDGKMLHWSGKRVDLLVTPEHQLYVANRHLAFKWRPAKEVFLINRADTRFLIATNGYTGKIAKYFDIPKCDTYNGRTKGITRFPIVPWLKFFGWYVTEGCAIHNATGYKIHIAQDKSENVPDIVSCIKQLGFHPWMSRWGTCVVFASKELHHYLKQFGTSYDRFIPKEIKELSPELLRILVETMMKGDGGEVVYYTCSEQLADDFQEILAKIGWGSNKTKDKGRNTYSVTIAREHLTTSVGDARRFLEDYYGDVYDVTVPNHRILVRRKGKMMWCGNCFNFRMADLNAAVGLIQMDKLRFLIDWQVGNAEYLIERLPSYLEVPKVPSHKETCRYLIGCHFNEEKAGMTREEFLGRMKPFQIGPRQFVGGGYSKLISDVTFYAGFAGRKFPMSEKLLKESIWLDWHRHPRTKEEIDKLLEALRT